MSTSSSSAIWSSARSDPSSRRFVLEPLLELDPELTLPDGTLLAEALARVREQRVRQLPGAEL